MKKRQYCIAIQRSKTRILRILALFLVLMLTIGFASCTTPVQTQQESIPESTAPVTLQPTSATTSTPIPMPEFTPEPTPESTPYYPENVPCSYGVFTLKNRSGQYLSRSEGELCLSEQATSWYLRPAEQENTWHIVLNMYRTKMLDINNAWYNNGNKVKLWDDTGNAAQHWQYEEYAPGEYIIVCAEEPEFVLASSDRGFFITRRNAIEDRDIWSLQLKQIPIEPVKIKGARGIVTVLLQQRILKVISIERLQQWVNDLESAYDSYAELVGSASYDTVFIEASEPQLYWGFYTYGSNVICIDSNSIYEDLRKMAVREAGDWNFGVLHEMSHLFDDGHSWEFDSEATADLKLFYVMQANNICATPSEFGAYTSFRGLEILNAARELGGYLENGYGVWEMTAKLTEIAQEIGWDIFKTVFREFPELKEGTSDAKKLKVFLDLLTEASGRDVRAMFTPEEWASVTEIYPMK